MNAILKTQYYLSLQYYYYDIICVNKKIKKEITQKETKFLFAWCSWIFDLTSDGRDTMNVYVRTTTGTTTLQKLVLFLRNLSRIEKYLCSKWTGRDGKTKIHIRRKKIRLTFSLKKICLSKIICRIDQVCSF